MQKFIEKFSTLSDIAVIGDIGLDKYTEGIVDRISPEAPVPVVKVTNTFYRLGLAANVANNLAALEISSILCGAVARDEGGVYLRNYLKKMHLTSDGVLDLLPSTIIKERITTKMQQICRVDYENDAFLNSKLIWSKLKLVLKNASAVILSDYAKGFLSEKLITDIITFFKDQGKIVAVDPHIRVDPHIYAGATIFKPNLKEARTLASKLNITYNSYEQLASKLRDELDVDNVVITLGDVGMIVAEKSKSYMVTTTKTEVFDVSGAGDTVISLIVACVLVGATLKQAVEIANKGAGLVVAKRGTATISTAELLKRKN